MAEKHLLLLNGSRKNGTSASFVTELKRLAEERGNSVAIVHVADCISGKISFSTLLGSLREADIVGLVSPLYADTLPYMVTWLFELLEAQGAEVLADKDFFAIVQSGFPDIALCKPAAQTAAFFAEDMGMRWLGSLTYGFGALIDGKSVKALGGKGRKITAAFGHLLEAVCSGESISPKLEKALVTRLPRFLYYFIVIFLNREWRKKGKKNGINDLARPVYLE